MYNLSKWKINNYLHIFIKDTLKHKQVYGLSFSFIFYVTVNEAIFLYIFIQTNFFHNFHLSESRFTCTGLWASGLARRLHLNIRIVMPSFYMKYSDSLYAFNESPYLWHHYLRYLVSVFKLLLLFIALLCLLWPSVTLKQNRIQVEVLVSTFIFSFSLLEISCRKKA
jgi:hypothetical protein